MRFLAFVACLLAGCDLALGLEERDPPRDAPPDVAGDSDGDTLIDADDNCPATMNLDQHDEDGDKVGDVCDNCPHVANASQDNTDGDTLGEACDDSSALDCLVRFDPFTTPPTGTGTNGTWVAEGGDAVVQTDPAIRNGYLIVDPTLRSNPLIISRAHVRELGALDDFSNLGIWGEASVQQGGAGVPAEGFIVEALRTLMVPADPAKSGGLHVSRRTGGVPSNDQLVPFSPPQVMSESSTVDLRLDMRIADNLRSSARLDGGAELVVLSPISQLPAGVVALRAYKMAAAFDYVVIIERTDARPCPGRN